jgi:hypothetical protein
MRPKSLERSSAARVRPSPWWRRGRPPRRSARASVPCLRGGGAQVALGRLTEREERALGLGAGPQGARARRRRARVVGVVDRSTRPDRAADSGPPARRPRAPSARALPAAGDGWAQGRQRPQERPLALEQLDRQTPGLRVRPRVHLDKPGAGRGVGLLPAMRNPRRGSGPTSRRARAPPPCPWRGVVEGGGLRPGAVVGRQPHELRVEHRGARRRPAAFTVLGLSKRIFDARRRAARGSPPGPSPAPGSAPSRRTSADGGVSTQAPN